MSWCRAVVSRWLVVGAKHVCTGFCFLAAQQLCVERAEAFLHAQIRHAAVFPLHQSKLRSLLSCCM